MTYLDFARAAHAKWVYEEQRGTFRKGQCYFNYLREVRPELARKLQLTDMNPFMDTSRLPAMLEWLINNWHLDYNE